MRTPTPVTSVTAICGRRVFLEQVKRLGAVQDPEVGGLAHLGHQPVQ